MRLKRLISYCSIALACSTILTHPCSAQTLPDRVCKSPPIELTRYQWGANQWLYIRDSESKTYAIEDLVFKASLLDNGIYVQANAVGLVSLDYPKYLSHQQDLSRHRQLHYTTFHHIYDKNVVVRILNFAPDHLETGGFRWCLLEIYVETTQQHCESAGGTFMPGFPEIPLIGRDSK